jgi:hypothetical protein
MMSLLDYTILLCKPILVLMLCAMAFSAYAYIVNARRSDDDPEKRNYRSVTILFVPVTLPALLILSVSIFILRVLIYGIFLVVFAISLLMIRKPFLLPWLHKLATTIGNKLLEANMLLVKFFLKPGANSP